MDAVVCQALRKGSPNFLDKLKEQNEVKIYTFHQLTAPSAAEKSAGWDTAKDLEARAPDTRIGDCLRQMLRELAKGERTVSQLAEPFSMSLAAASKHIRTLEDAGLIRRQVLGRTHLCRLDARPLAPDPVDATS